MREEFIKIRKILGPQTVVAAALGMSKGTLAAKEQGTRKVRKVDMLALYFLKSTVVKGDE